MSQKRQQTLVMSFILLFLFACSEPVDTPPVEQHKTEVESATVQPKQPKNIILMISDGIGFNGWLAADYYQGMAGKQSYQVARPDGTQPLVLGMAHSALNLVDEQGTLITDDDNIDKATGSVEQGYDPKTRWDRFENSMLNDFDPVAQSYTSYTDSAAAGTALMSGYKTSNGRINMDWSGTQAFNTIAAIAIQQGRSAGAVSSVMASHATPAAVIAQNASRRNYADIFNEMLSSDLSVIMGAGHPEYGNSGEGFSVDEDKEFKYVGGEQTYLSMSEQMGVNGFSFIDAKEDFEALAAGKVLPEKVVGIARAGATLQAVREGLGEANNPSGMAFNLEVPDLATMSKAALNVLNQDKEGFFVMIEGGAVDWMGHANNMPRYIEEQIDFNNAVDAVIDWVETHSSWDDTLLIVTSDHECGGIWGEGTWTNGEGGAIVADRSEAALESARFNPDEDVFNEFLAVQDKGAGNIPGFQFASRYHTNELVPLWALGATADSFNTYVQMDAKAANLWGSDYGWTGEYVDNTSVFKVMQAALMGVQAEKRE
jgi:alkaline phosphatase